MLRWQFIHDPLLTWRLTDAASPAGPNFASTGGHAPRARRPSILDADHPPSEHLAAQAEASVTAGGPPGPRTRARTNSSLVNGAAEGPGETEAQNARALEVLARVNQKLNGREFKQTEELDVVTQVNKLIMEATRLENLCQHYIGWCSFW
jgi:FKBP12-rapamycin complex-associated protein